MTTKVSIVDFVYLPPFVHLRPFLSLVGRGKLSEVIVYRSTTAVHPHATGASQCLCTHPTISTSSISQVRHTAEAASVVCSHGETPCTTPTPGGVHRMTEPHKKHALHSRFCALIQRRVSNWDNSEKKKKKKKKKKKRKRENGGVVATFRVSNIG